jgi:hypothetical protein
MKKWPRDEMTMERRPVVDGLGDGCWVLAAEEERHVKWMVV